MIILALLMEKKLLLTKCSRQQIFGYLFNASNQRRTLYCATFVFEPLYNAGEALVSKNNGLKCVTGSDFIVSDLNDTIDRFRDYRKKLNSKFFVYENEDGYMN